MYKRTIDEITLLINKRLEEINASLISSISYKNTKTKFRLKCNIDEHQWDTNYERLINRKNKCPKCSGQVISKEEANDKIHERLKEINASLREPFIYKNSYSRIKLKCNIDSYQWETTYNNFVNNRTRCSKCSKRVLYDDEIKTNIENRLHEINASLIEPYIHENNNSKLKLKCNVDGHIWETKYSNFINNRRGCAKCSKNLKITQQESELKVNERCKEMDYELYKPFIFKKTSNTLLSLKCKKCDGQWEVIYNNFLSRKSGCPKCCESKGEYKIESFLKKRKLSYVSQKVFKDCKDKDYLKFDFYLEDFKTCIEFDGVQHFKAFDFFGGIPQFEDVQKKDNIKNKYCESNNINLIRIPYDKYNNIENILIEKLIKY